MNWGDVQGWEKPVPKLMRATRDFQIYQPVLMDEYLEEGDPAFREGRFLPHQECMNKGAYYGSVKIHAVEGRFWN